MFFLFDLGLVPPDGDDFSNIRNPNYSRETSSLDLSAQSYNKPAYGNESWRQNSSIAFQHDRIQQVCNSKLLQYEKYQ